LPWVGPDLPLLDLTVEVMTPRYESGEARHIQ
jgi:hypothetical protein